MVHTRQSRPDSGLGFQVNVPEASGTFKDPEASGPVIAGGTDFARGSERGASPCYRGTSVIRKRTPLGPYRKPMPRVLGGSYRSGCFLMGEVLLYTRHLSRCLWRVGINEGPPPFSGGPVIPGGKDFEFGSKRQASPRYS